MCCGLSHEIKKKKKKENNEMKSSAIKKPHVRPTHIHTRSHIRSKEPRKHTHTHFSYPHPNNVLCDCQYLKVQHLF